MIATSAATSRAHGAAMTALTRSPPRSTNRVSNGSIATRAEANSEPPTGSKTCLYTAPPLSGRGTTRSGGGQSAAEQRCDGAGGDLGVARRAARDLDADDALRRLGDLVEHAL